MKGSPHSGTAEAIRSLIDYHNQPTLAGRYLKIDRPGFCLQQLPLSEVDFAMLMSDFFITFGVSSEHYDEARYFPVQPPRRAQLARWFGFGSSVPYRPLTVAMLCDAARQGCWPQED
ncbi:DUF1493 family protein [Pantoea sp. C2G6]|uniref:DUF1493 family protein n=1 Tax=Pantoea sp. C2G6 TaxID=3243084 RepID=UPI003EDB2398